MGCCECGLLAELSTLYPKTTPPFQEVLSHHLVINQEKSPPQLDVVPPSSPPCGYMVAAAKTPRDPACLGEPGVLNGPDRMSGPCVLDSFLHNIEPTRTHLFSFLSSLEARPTAAALG